MRPVSGNMLAMLMIAGVGLAASGCATVTRGTSETLVVRTIPDAAGVSLRTSDGAVRTCAATPCTFVLPRRTQAVVLIQKDGFQSVRVDVRGRLGTFVPLGVVGAAVDIASGAALSLQPNPIEVTLSPGSGQIDLPPPTAQSPPSGGPGLRN